MPPRSELPPMGAFIVAALAPFGKCQFGMGYL